MLWKRKRFENVIRVVSNNKCGFIEIVFRFLTSLYFYATGSVRSSSFTFVSDRISVMRSYRLPTFTTFDLCIILLTKTGCQVSTEHAMLVLRTQSSYADKRFLLDSE